MKIVKLHQESHHHFTEVLELGRKNSKTLGFLPEGAYKAHAIKGQLITAINTDDCIIGYLLYSVNRRQGLVSIVHLCIELTYRKQGVASALKRDLEATTKAQYRGIRVHCRRDYNLDIFWQELGFVALGEKSGRGKKAEPLTVWWYDYGHPTLFSQTWGQRTHTKDRVTIDANVFFDLCDPPIDANRESHSLLADWLADSCDLYITDEIYNEINRHPNKSERNKKRKRISQFQLLTHTNIAYSDSYKKLRSLLFQDGTTDSDKSDLRHLAYTIEAGIKIFITRDGVLLDEEEKVYQNFGLRVLRPLDFIIQQDTLTRETEYQPSRLAGISFQVTRIPENESVSLEEVFRSPTGERKSAFRKLIRGLLSNPQSYQNNVISNKNRDLAFISFGRLNPTELTIPVFRLVRNPIASTLARHLISHIIRTASREGRQFTVVTEPKLSSTLADALQEMGFVRIDNIFVRANMLIALSSSNILEHLSSIEYSSTYIGKYLESILIILRESLSLKDTDSLLRIEKSLWPMKLIDLNIPTYIVPIKPTWAMNLFYTKISEQDLFGGNPELFLKVENAYYRNCRPKVLTAPSRILWYISKGAGDYRYVQSIGASSYVDEILIDRPKVLYSRFKRLGVFQWNDVLNIAGGSLSKDIMGFKFSGTEVFQNPIELATLKDVWVKTTGKQLILRGPLRISNDIFFNLYNTGTFNKGE